MRFVQASGGCIKRKKRGRVDSANVGSTALPDLDHVVCRIASIQQKSKQLAIIRHALKKQ